MVIEFSLGCEFPKQLILTMTVLRYTALMEYNYLKQKLVIGLVAYLQTK